METLKYILLNSHRNSGENTNYIVLSAPKCMLKTSHGKFIGAGAKQLYTGQTLAINEAGANNISGSKNILDFAISNLSKNCANVGGLRMSAEIFRHGFNYVTEAYIHIHTPDAEEKGGGVLDQNSDKLTYMILAPKRRSIPLLATYIPEMGRGYVYDHVHHDYPMTFSESDVFVFANSLLQHYGFQFEVVQLEHHGFSRNADGTYNARVYKRTADH